MSKRFIPYFTLFLLVVTSTFIVWLPFLLRLNGLDFLTLYKHFDGPLYIIVAKTFYNLSQIAVLYRDGVFPQNPLYFTAHLPLYPMLIRLFSFLGYLRSMLFATLLSTIGFALFFLFFVKHYSLTKKTFLLSAVMLFLPRFLVVRSIGAPESLFMLCILLSLYFFEKDKYLFAGLFGAAAVMTKTPGLLLFFAYILVFFEKYHHTNRITKNWFWIFLIPIGLLLVFGLYFIQTGNFFAYFQSGDNIHLTYPFSVFNFNKPWIGTGWLEDILFIFFIYGLTVYKLISSKHRSFFYFSLVYFIALLCVEHRDISRYSLPLWPMACVAFEQFFTSKKFLVVLLILLPAIYLYAWNFIIFNSMPITEWLPFL